MKIRNVVKIGNSYYVSLPKSWVKEFLRNSRAVYVNVSQEGTIEIRPLNKGEGMVLREIKLIFSPIDTIRKTLAAYLNGYDIIEIETKEKGFPKKFLEDLNRLCNLLIGLEIIEESKKRIILQCFSDAEPEITPLVRRMDSITRSMYKDALEGWINGLWELVEAVARKDDSVDKLYFLAVRGIRKAIMDPMKPGEEKVKLLDLRLTVQSLERVGDVSEKLALDLLEKGYGYKIAKKEAQLVRKMVHELHKYQRKLVDLTLMHEKEAGLIKDLDSNVKVSLDKLGEKVLGKTSKTLRMVLGHLNEIYDILTDLSDLIS
ncbi:MAG: phosphate uptake regulator PhoU [Thermoproteales archaeon]|nr:phosphate uptake regulator PhoU [Thermoproteales archaeon]